MSMFNLNNILILKDYKFIELIYKIIIIRITNMNIRMNLIIFNININNNRI